MSLKTNDDQFKSLKLLIETDLQDTLLGDILSDSFQMLKLQVSSDFAWANFKNYSDKIHELENNIIALQNTQKDLQIENKELEAEGERLRNSAHKARKDVETLHDRLDRVLSRYHL